MEAESKFLIGWEVERAELKAELCRLQEELAESQAEREELQSRAHALTDRLSETVDMSMSLRMDSEQKEWRRKLKEGKERESRQALLIHKLQNKVLEYRALCERLEQQVQTAERKRILHRDEHSDAMEGALIRLEEEQQRCVALVEVNALLRSELSQSTEANHALKDDLKKLTADWSKAVEEVGQREIDWHQEKQMLSGYVEKEHSRLMKIWGGVETLRRQCHTIKTATDKDLWELRAEFSRLSSTLLSLSCFSVASCTHTSAPLSSTHSSAPLPSTPGPMTVEDLDQVQSINSDLTVVQEQSSGLRSRIGELMAAVKAQECELQRLHEEKQDREQRLAETERGFGSVKHAAQNLYRVIVSQKLDGRSRSVSDRVEPSDGLSSLLEIIAQAETTLQWRHQELQEAEGSLRRLRVETETLKQQIKELGDEREELQDRAKQGALELKQTQSLLNSEKEIVEGLRRQLMEMERHGEGLKKENERLRFQREKEDEERHELERERQRRVKTELLENVQLCERERRSRLELQSLQGALERERLDRASIEKEATETKDALVKARESLVVMSASHTLLKREVTDGRDALEKMAALNESLVRDKRELSSQTLQLEEELAASHIQMQKFRSDVSALQRELKAVSMEASQLRAHRDTELDSLQQVRQGEVELQRELQTLREERGREATALAEEKAKNKELCEQHRSVYAELENVKAELSRSVDQEKILQRETHTCLEKNQQLAQTNQTLERQNEELKQDREELRDLSVALQQQLAVEKDQASGLEVQCTQLNMQVHTLLQAKDVLHGEIQCLQVELERETVLRQQEKLVASEERRRREKEVEHCQAEIMRLQHETQRASEQLKIREDEQDEEREQWQREREALNSELGQNDGEVESLRNRMDALERQNRELSDMVDEKNGELEQLGELARECKALDFRLQQADEETERWKTRTVDIQREKEELNRRLLETEERHGAESEISKKEKDNLASILRKREIEIQKKDKDTEEFILKMRLQEDVIETLEAQVTERTVLEGKLAALEEQNAQLKEIERAQRKEEEGREKERKAEQREKEEKLRGELRQNETELEALKDRVEELLKEKKHMSGILEEKEDNLEKLQNELTRQQKNLELVAMEAKDEMERWKRRAGDMEKEKEVVNQRLVDRAERERTNLTALEQEREDLRNDLRERREEMQKREDDIMDLKSTIQLLEGELENERKLKEMAEGQFIVLEEQNSQLLKRDQERVKEWDNMEEEHKAQQRVLQRELKQRNEEVENLRSKAEEILKERDEALDRMGERDIELERLKTRLTKEQLAFEKRVKDDEQQKDEWKTRVEELEKELLRSEESRTRLMGEGREREQELSGEISRMGEELKELVLKVAELDGENREMQKKTLEQKEFLLYQTTLLREREQDTNRLREILEQKEKDENEKVQQGQEDVRRLKERLSEMDQQLMDTQAALEQEGHQCQAREKELLDCKQQLQLADAKCDKEEEKVQDLEERNKRLMGEVEMLRGKFGEWSGEMERKSQLLQDSEREVRKLNVTVEEKEQLSRSLRQREQEVKKFEILLEVRRVEEEKLRSKLEELQQEQCSLVEKSRRHVVKLETRVRELEEERDHLSAELGRKERDVDACKEETVREKQEKESMSVTLKHKEEELKEVQEREESAARQVVTLQQEVAALSASKEHASSALKERAEENRRMRAGLKAGLDELATLKALLEESHREGERLRIVLQGKKDELVRSKVDSDRAARLDADLQIRVQILEKNNQDLQAELLLRDSELKKNLEAFTRERQTTERREDNLRTLEAVVKQKEAELAEVRSRKDFVEEQRCRDLSHVVMEKTNEVEKLTSRVKELEEVLKEKNQDLKKSEQMIESLEKANCRQNKLQEREEVFECFKKELREREMDEMKKMQVEERTNARLKHTEEQRVKDMEFAKEKLNEKEAKLEKMREIAFKEEEIRGILQAQLEDAKRETRSLKRLAESLDKEKHEKIAKLERDMHYLRECEKNSNEFKKKIYRQLQHNLTDISGIGCSQIEMRDALKKELEKDTCTTKVEPQETSMEGSQALTGRDEEDRNPQDGGGWEVLCERVCTELLEKQETIRRLREKELEVYTLKEQTEELNKDRERVRTALEKTESMLIRYKERLRLLDQEKQTRTEAAVGQVGDMEGRCGEEGEERLCSLQRAVAQLELQHMELQQRNTHLEQHVQRLKTQRQHLRDTLKQVELERGKLRHQLSRLGPAMQESSIPAAPDELDSLRAHAGELAEQVQRLHLMLAASQEEQNDFIDRSLMNSQKLEALRQDLRSSLLLVSQRLLPAVLQAETDRLDQSIREEELNSSLSQS